MTPVGYWDKEFRFIYGPGDKNFMMSSAPSSLTPFYLTPQFEGQEPFAVISPSPGVFLFYKSDLKDYPDFLPVYEGVKNERTNQTIV